MSTETDQTKTIKKLTNDAPEIRAGLGALLDSMALVTEVTSRTMPADRAWATLATSVAEQLGLDLDTTNGLMAAALIAEAHLRLHAAAPVCPDPVLCNLGGHLADDEHRAIHAMRAGKTEQAGV